MSYTVEASFDKFRQNIELSGDHRETANARRDRIVTLLKDQFTILEAFSSGSIPRYTALKNNSDLDIIVALHYGKHVKDKKPSEVLQSVRDCLAEYKTNVRKNGQAVTLHYKTWPNVDVVPVSQVVNDDGGVIHYKVPNMNNETWIKSRPKTHSSNMTDKNKNCGDLFKRIVKMIKQWNSIHGGLLQSFHIEVMAMSIYNRKLENYSWNVYCFFNQACELIKNSLYYDGFQVDTYLDSDKRAEILKRLEIAKAKALDAWYLTYNGRDDHEKAIGIWKQIFGDKFPNFG